MRLHPDFTDRAIRAVIEERDRQDEKWGEQNHSLPLWLAILSEEVGEFSTEVLNKTFDHRPMENARAEAVQIAAVSVAIVEFIDRWNTFRESGKVGSSGK